MNRPLWDQWAEVMAKGDWMMGILVAIAATLWFSIGYRAVLLFRGSKKPLEALLADPPPFTDDPKAPFRGFVVEAVAAAVHVRRRLPPPWANRMDGYLQPLSERMKALRNLVTTLVALAPMAGLLGTVAGMMVMFNSIGDSNFSSQTAGITNGIAQALFTTEAALVVAVPCLVLGRVLNRREDALRRELEQIVRTLCSREARP